MDKVIIVTYRKLYKLCSRVDRSVPLRCALCAGPRYQYNAALGTWIPCDISGFMEWKAPRRFLDGVLHHLNNGRMCYIPPYPEEVEAAHGAWRQRIAHAAKSDTPASVVSSEQSPGIKSSIPGWLPRCLMPYDSLTKTLRLLFENTPFLPSNLDIAFNALKTLNKLTELVEHTASRRVVVPQEWRGVPLLPLRRSAEVQPMNTATPAVGDSSRDTRRGFRRPVSFSKSGVSKDVVASTEVSSPALPAVVQLLLSHPLDSGLFGHTVLLMVQHSSTSSAAFILNKPLLSSSGEMVTLGTALDLEEYHPIFSQFLNHHVAMVGGPVLSSGDMERNLFLLHRIPDIPDATSLASGLWLDGCRDALMEKLISKEASPDDIVLLLGYSGWGCGQLEGELMAGQWVLASGPSKDATLASLPMLLRKDKQTTLASMAPKTRERFPRKGHAGPPSEWASDLGLPYVSIQERRGRQQTVAWMWVYAALGEPWSLMAECQLFPCEEEILE